LREDAGVSHSSGEPSSGAVDRAAVQRRTLAVLVLAQVLGGAGFFVGIAVAALLARELTGSAAWAGAPPALAVAVSALAAPPLSRLMGRSGRRAGLALGSALGALGALLVLVAAHLDAAPLMFLGMALFGIVNTSNLLARYAAADLSASDRRARAIAVVLLATAAGAIAGPNLAAPTAALAAGLGMPPAAGGFAVAAAASGLAALVVVALLRPDPLLTARRLDAAATSAGELSGPAAGPTSAVPTGDRRVAVGTAALVLVTAVMVAVMTMSPVHIEDHGGSLAVVGVVLSAHVAGMYLPSPVTGWLSDRVGRAPVIAAGGAALIAAGLLGAVAAPTSAAFAVALALLGVGWNLGLIGGSALITDAAPAARLTEIQGRADLTMGLAGAGAAVAAGPVLGAAGFGTLGIASAVLAAVLVGVAVGLARTGRPAPRAV
jgi:MFS family permease